MVDIKEPVKVLQRLAKYRRIIINPPEVKVGFLSGSTYPDGTSLPLVAATNEYGVPSKGQPPRPFMRNAVAKHKAEWGPATARNLRATDFNVDKTLERMGQGIKGQVQQSINELREPPLAPSTIKAKGFDKPLIDTGYMLDRVDYNVYRKK